MSQMWMCDLSVSQTAQGAVMPATVTAEQLQRWQRMLAESNDDGPRASISYNCLADEMRRAADALRAAPAEEIDVERLARAIAQAKYGGDDTTVDDVVIHRDLAANIATRYRSLGEKGGCGRPGCSQCDMTEHT